MTRRALLLPAAATLVAAGCVMPDQMAKIQKDIADAQQQIAAVSKSQDDLKKRVDAVDAKLGGGDVVKRSELADLKAQMDDVVRQTSAGTERLNDVAGRVDRLSQDVQVARDSARRAAAPAPAAGGAAAPGDAPGGPPVPVPVPVPEKPGGGSTPNPNALYTSAYADFSKGNYALAIQGFEEYATSFPQTELADNAMYWIGECWFSQGDSKSAIKAFDAMLGKYPSSDKAAAANLKKALAYLQLNQVGQGVEQLRYVVTTYPGSDESRIAKDRLAALGKP